MSCRGCPTGESSSPFYFRLSVEDRPGALARVADELAQRDDLDRAARCSTPNGNGAALHVVTHEARAGALADALDGARRAARGAQALAAAARDLGSRRLRSSDGRDLADPARLARRGLDAARLGGAPLGARLGYDLHLKLEGANPTGSFKDRGMVVAVARAVEAGARAVVCASTGNTAASAAAYAARAGLDGDRAHACRCDGDREARAGASLPARG